MASTRTSIPAARLALAAGLLLVVAAAAIAVHMARDLGRNAPAAIKIGGDFTLTDQHGARFSSGALQGHPHLVFFGFTHCPDICPTTLQTITNLLADLGPDAGKLKVVFVSVDPERDTASFLKDYLSAFDPRIIGLTGTSDEIKSVSKLYRAFYEKVPGTGGDYTMNHTATVYLMDRKGGLVSTMNHMEKPEVQLTKLKNLLAR